MKIFLTFTLAILSTNILIGAPFEKEPLDKFSVQALDKNITFISSDLPQDSTSQKPDAEVATDDKISNVNSSYLNFRSLEKGRRILEKKYRLYT